DKPDTPRIGSRETRRANTSFQDVFVQDARPRLAAGEISLDHSGFTLSENATKVTDFRDEALVESVYYPEIQNLVRTVSGASQVIVKGHLIRTETPVDFNDGYARFVHCDYNVARNSDMADELFERDGITPQKNWTYVWYNTWQPFDHVVQNNPLAVIDWKTLPQSDVIDYFYTGRNRDSLVAAPVYNADHQFCYFPDMETNEVIVFTQIDERPGHAVYCPHTSFDMMEAASGTLPRRSIEMRVLAIFENED
ncbi:MAG: CmcJ/NvfI family oxidoreductase, partial [Alphaproteobacteria bacterium]